MLLEMVFCKLSSSPPLQLALRVERAKLNERLEGGISIAHIYCDARKHKYPDTCHNNSHK